MEPGPANKPVRRDGGSVRDGHGMRGSDGVLKIFELNVNSGPADLTMQVEGLADVMRPRPLGSAPRRHCHGDAYSGSRLSENTASSTNQLVQAVNYLLDFDCRRPSDQSADALCGQRADLIDLDPRALGQTRRATFER